MDVQKQLKMATAGTVLGGTGRKVKWGDLGECKGVRPAYGSHVETVSMYAIDPVGTVMLGIKFKRIIMNCWGSWFFLKSGIGLVGENV